MNKRFYRLLAFAMIFVMLVSLACSLGGTSTKEPGSKETEEATQASAPTEEAAPEGLVTSLDDVKSAAIQIESEGTFVDPAVGLVVNGAGRGTGFIIDPSGIAITNNHVVTGAALIKVWVGGESEPRNAKILGVSECSDLAVIDISGDGYPYLDWYDGETKVGTDVYAAGFPLGDPEYTLTRGVISKARADGETSWASVDSVLEHDATINPGNSGGPLVNSDGQVMGVNYAKNDAGQSFAIGRAEAMSVVDDLRAGNDVTSIGVNGQAVMSEDGSISGIWVSSVKSGSPADKAGVEAGDIITQIEGLVLATDGTMSDYCDILRTHDPEDTLSLTVLRYSTGEVLEGQLNGEPLQTAVSFFGDQVEDQVDTDSSADQTGQYTEYSSVKDDNSIIEVELPAEWSEIDGTLWENTWTISNGTEIPFKAASVVASANLDAYNNGYDESGMSFSASEDWGRIGGYLQLLEGVRGWYEEDCTLEGTYDYSDGLYEGKYDLWKNCGDNDTGVLMLAARPIENQTAFLILVEVKITKDADLDALDHVLSTFQVIGDF